MRVAWLVLLCVASVVGVGCSGSSVGLQIQHITIGEQSFTVEVARTASERAYGLQGRDSLDAGTGMRFAFARPGRYSVWMKNTRIPIDAVWVSDGVVVGIVERMEPEIGVPDEDLREYGVSRDATDIIEFPAGTVKSNGLSLGDPVVFPAP